MRTFLASPSYFPLFLSLYSFHPSSNFSPRFLQHSLWNDLPLDGSWWWLHSVRKRKQDEKSLLEEENFKGDFILSFSISNDMRNEMMDSPRTQEGEIEREKGKKKYPHSERIIIYRIKCYLSLIMEWWECWNLSLIMEWWEGWNSC